MDVKNILGFLVSSLMTTTLATKDKDLVWQTGKLHAVGVGPGTSEAAKIILALPNPLN